MSSDFILKVVYFCHFFYRFSDLGKLYLCLDHFPYILLFALSFPLCDRQHEIPNKFPSFFFRFLSKLKFIEDFRCPEFSFFHTKSITHNDNHNGDNESPPNGNKKDDKSANRSMRVIISIANSCSGDEDEPKSILIVGDSTGTVERWIDKSLSFG